MTILFLVIAGGVLLRGYGIYERSMWFDESASWRIARLPFSEMFGRIALDNHVPLFFLLLRAWMGLFGESLVSLRSLNLATSVPAMLGVYLFTVEAFNPEPTATEGDCGQPRRRWLRVKRAETNQSRNASDARPHPAAPHPVPLSRRARGDASARWIGVVATALFAVSLFQIRSAWEIRMYTLGTALAMISSWLLLRARSGQCRARR